MYVLSLGTFFLLRFVFSKSFSLKLVCESESEEKKGSEESTCS